MYEENMQTPLRKDPAGIQTKTSADNYTTIQLISIGHLLTQMT